jgi:excinuclease UvrABC nuclease subunit
MILSTMHQHLRGKSGIYALKKRGKIVYVGSSLNIYTRILEHKADNKKDFDEISYHLYFSGNSGANFARKILEMGVICELTPKYNKIFFDNYKFWLYSLPCEEAEAIDRESYRLIVKMVKKIIKSLDGQHEH